MITVFITDAQGAPEITDIKGIRSDAARFDLWDAVKPGLAFHWRDFRPTVNWAEVRLPQWIRRQDIRLRIS
jgi:hypothetical protein